MVVSGTAAEVTVVHLQEDVVREAAAAVRAAEGTMDWKPVMVGLRFDTATTTEFCFENVA